MRPRQLTGATLVLLLSLTLGCVTMRVSGGPSSSLQEASLSIGDRQYQLSACTSGDREYFLGVDLADQARSAFVRLVIDPTDGPRVQVTSLDGETRTRLVLGPNQCRLLETDVRPTRWRVNRVRDFSGFIDAECRSDEGQTISLHVHFFHCH